MRPAWEPLEMLAELSARERLVAREAGLLDGFDMVEVDVGEL